MTCVPPLVPVLVGALSAGSCDRVVVGAAAPTLPASVTAVTPVDAGTATTLRLAEVVSW